MMHIVQILYTSKLQTILSETQPNTKETAPIKTILKQDKDGAAFDRLKI